MRGQTLIRNGSLVAVAFLSGALGAAAQRPRLAQNVRQYVKVDTAVLALINVRVIDGTGAPSREIGRA